MKLVDILARKITEWPQGQPCLWISDAHSATIYGKSGSFEVSFNGDWRCPEDYLDAIVYKAEWQAAVDALKADKVVVNEVYEVVEGSVDWFESDRQFIGQRVSVHHIFRNAFGVDMAAVENKDGECLALRLELLAEIRTPEQIAAEVRQKAINQICIDAGSPEMTPGQLRVASKLYDAGYRKFEIVDN